MIVKSWLVAHEFSALTEPQQLPPRLATLWRRVASDLGMQPRTELDPRQLGDGMGTGTLTTVSYADRPRTGDELYQAALASSGDAACLTMVLDPDDGTRTWASIEAELAWAEMEYGPADLGGARVYVGLVASNTVDQTTAKDLAPTLAAQLGVPDGAAHTVDDWTRRPSLTTDGFLLWEAPPTRPRQRRFVLIGPETEEKALDAFAWTPGGGRLGPFVQYLLDAAKLHEQRRLHQESRANIRRLRQQTEEAVGRLLTLHRTTPVTPTDLVTADAALTDVQASSAGVITHHAQLRKVARNVDAALSNLRRLVPLASGWRGPLAEDQAAGEALREQVADDITELEIARDQAEKVSALTATAVQRGLGTAQQQLLLIQTSVIGSILMILAAIQSFGIKLPLPDSLQLPLVFFLGSLALALPTAVLHYSRHVPQDLPLRGVNNVMVFLAGAATGWLSSEMLSLLVPGVSLSVWSTLVVCVVTGVGAVGLVELRARRVAADTRAQQR